MKANQARQVLDADLANILRKVKAGKTLTTGEPTKPAVNQSAMQRESLRPKKLPT